MREKHVFLRLLSALSGLLLIATGALCLLQPGAALQALSTLLGVSMLISGIFGVVGFALCGDAVLGAGYLLLDGVVAILLSALTLLNRLFSPLALPALFSLWMLFSGVSRFVRSLDLRRLGVRGWGWFTAMGALEMLGGFATMAAPFAALLTQSLTAGGIFALEGVLTAASGLLARRTGGFDGAHSARDRIM